MEKKNKPRRRRRRRKGINGVRNCHGVRHYKDQQLSPNSQQCRQYSAFLLPPTSHNASPYTPPFPLHPLPSSLLPLPSYPQHSIAPLSQFAPPHIPPPSPDPHLRYL
ncbi:hypothetical protein IC582_027604 [Cucumis melo]